MLTTLRNASLILLASLVFACASQEPAMQEEAPLATGPTTPNAYCKLSAEELTEVKARALAHLLENWPVLDASCEQISDNVVYIHADQCAIQGAPRRSDQCEEPSHEGYNIVFVRDTLEPLQVYFKVEAQ